LESWQGSTATRLPLAEKDGLARNFALSNPLAFLAVSPRLRVVSVLNHSDYHNAYR
jgi:hypothetical protein